MDLVFKDISSKTDIRLLNSIAKKLGIKTISYIPKEEFWDTLTKEQKKEISIALDELDADLGITHEKVMAKYKGKYI